MNERIGRAVTALLELADEIGIRPTATPIGIEMLNNGTKVTLHACHYNGDDVKVMLLLADGAVCGHRRTTGFRRDWTGSGYTDWYGYDEAEMAYEAVA